MSRIDVQDRTTIDASREKIWAAIQDPTAHATWHPFLKRIQGDHALSARRTCDVLVGKKTGTTQERCVAYDEGRTIAWLIEEDSTGFSRMVSDFKAGFTLEEDGPNRTVVIAQSSFTPRAFFVKLMAPMMRGKFSKTHRQILKGLKDYVETNFEAGGG